MPNDPPAYQRALIDHALGKVSNDLPAPVHSIYYVANGNVSKHQLITSLHDEAVDGALSMDLSSASTVLLQNSATSGLSFLPRSALARLPGPLSLEDGADADGDKTTTAVQLLDAPSFWSAAGKPEMSLANRFSRSALVAVTRAVSLAEINAPPASSHQGSLMAGVVIGLLASMSLLAAALGIATVRRRARTYEGSVPLTDDPHNPLVYFPEKVLGTRRSTPS